MLPTEHPTLFDLAAVESRWPTRDGMVSTAPAAWRFSVAELAAADLFYLDLLWAIQLELDQVEWPGRTPKRDPSILAAMADVAHLWGLPSASHGLPYPTHRSRYPRQPAPRAWRP